jgi:V8-like Glu-specific endopeptidase
MKRYQKLSLIGLALAALALPVVASVIEEIQGHPAPGEFDLQAAEFARKVLVDQLRADMPPSALVGRTRVDVSEQERELIAQSTEVRLRIGVVKALGEPVRFNGRSARDVARRSDGSTVWARTIEAPEATALRLHFTGVDLAPSAELFIHTSRGEAFGPYTGRGPIGTGEFWSHTVAGDTVTMQIRQPGGSRASSSFTLAEIGYVDLSKVNGLPMPSPQAGEQLCSFNANCVENANCNNLPAAITSARNAYAHMEFVQGQFLYYCTGGLIADTNPSNTGPYFLTANHCLSTTSVAGSLQNFFQYSVGCNGTCPTLYFYNQTPPPFPRTVGGTVRATNSTSDFTLIELSQAAPAGSSFLGWNKTAVANTNGTALYRISHPGGAPQAYSTHTVNTSRPTCQGWPRGAWIYSVDTLGATEGGSSGSPVLNSSGQVVGQLTGACGFNTGNVCDTASNATVDGAFANYFCTVRPFIAPDDTSCGGGGCTPKNGACTTNSQCCSNNCNTRNGRCR